jgi:hypothetical protein
MRLESSGCHPVNPPRANGESMTDKPLLEESVVPPECPHRTTSLWRSAWHGVEGGPGTVSYIVLLSCPHCKSMLGALGS